MNGRLLIDLLFNDFSQSSEFAGFVFLTFQMPNCILIFFTVENSVSRLFDRRTQGSMINYSSRCTTYTEQRQGRSSFVKLPSSSTLDVPRGLRHLSNGSLPFLFSVESITEKKFHPQASFHSLKLRRLKEVNNNEVSTFILSHLHSCRL